MALSSRSIERVSCRLSGRPDTDPTWRPPLISNPGGNRPQRSGCNLHDNNARPDRPFRALNVFRHPLETFLLVTDFLDAADVAAGAPSGPRNQGGRRKVSGASSYPACSLEDLAMRYDWTPCGGRPLGSTTCLTFSTRSSGPPKRPIPPYNIERLDENRFQISVALAGFTPDEVGLTVEQNVLTLEGHKAEKDEKTFLHRGMSTRSFKRQFTLADHVEVKGAHFENGLLVIELQREIPEAMKPRRIAIAGASAGQVKQIEGKAA